MKITLSVGLLLACCLNLNAAKLIEDHDCRMGIKVDRSEIKPGDTARVTVWVANAPKVYGPQAEIQISSDVLEVVDEVSAQEGIQGSPGELFPVTGGLVLRNVYDPETRRFVYAMSLTNPSEEVEGSGDVVSLLVRATKPGSATLALDVAQLGTRKGELVVPSIEADDASAFIGVMTPAQARRERSSSRILRAAIATMALSLLLSMVHRNRLAKEAKKAAAAQQGT